MQVYLAEQGRAGLTRRSTQIGAGDLAPALSLGGDATGAANAEQRRNHPSHRQRRNHTTNQHEHAVDRSPETQQASPEGPACIADFQLPGPHIASSERSEELGGTPQAEGLLGSRGANKNRTCDLTLIRGAL